jgi:hypothetical protein
MALPPPVVEGSLVTMHKQAQWPPMCVKCATQSGLVGRNQSYAWFPPWTYLLIFGGLLPAAIVQMILTKRATLILPICGPCSSRWTMARVVYVLSIVLPIVLGIIVAMAGAANGSSGLMVVGVALMFPGLLVFPLLAHFLLIRPRTVRPVFIDDWVVKLAGVHPAVLDALRGR